MNRNSANDRKPIKQGSLMVGLFLVVLVLSFQNCGQFYATNTVGVPAHFLSSGGSNLVPGTDRIDSTCMQNIKYDACLFRKNPVAQQGTAFATDLSRTTDLDNLQTYGVKITGLKDTGILDNGTVRIDTVRGQPVSTRTSTLKFNWKSDTSNSVLQVMAYYWLNRTIEYIDLNTGRLKIKGAGIRVVVDDTTAGWISRTKSIHLKLADNGNAMALDAALMIHYLGVANLDLASDGAINQLDASKHRTCGANYVYGCCSSVSGCARALSSGVGDYLAAVMFPDSPVIGESWVNRTTGVGFCNMDRNLNAAAPRTAQQAFDSCSASGGSGEVHSLGTVYASIWWEIRKAEAGRTPGGEIEVDKLYLEHLTLLTGQDDFSTALQKIKSVDQRLFNGRFSPSFDQEYVRRGL